jgi:hypothetical protein
MSPDNQTAPPCGAIASPQTVTTSDLAFGGEAASVRRIQRATPGSGPEALRGSILGVIDVIQKLRY